MNLSFSITWSDPNPNYTDYIIKQCNKVFGWDLGNGDRATAIKCATRLPAFYETNKHRILLYDIHYKFINQQVDFMVEALERNQSPDYPAKPVYLYSDLTYSKILPEHLKRVGSM